MSTATPKVEAEAVPTGSPLDHPFRINIELYNRMIAAGVLNGNDPAFLWEGRLVTRIPEGRPHSIAFLKLIHEFRALTPSGWHMECRQPVEIGDASVPEPDLMVVRGAIDDYLHRNPTAQDLALLVEAAESSLAIDRGPKLVAYARDRVPAYWIVSLPDRRIEAYTDPTGPADQPTYRTRSDYPSGEAVPLVIEGREIARLAVDDILPNF